MKKVLITGAAGLIGSILTKAFVDRYELRLLDIKNIDHQSFVKADITEFQDIERHFQDVDIVIHLAADKDMETAWDSIAENNITGTYNVFEAAKRNGVKRIIFTSTNHVMGMYALENVPTIDTCLPVRPDSLYGVSKLFGENLGCFYSENFNLSVICVRIGLVDSDDDPSGNAILRKIWLSHKDLVQLMEKAIEVNDVKYEIVNGVSKNGRSIFDLEHTKKVLGYDPKDDAEQFYA